MNGEGIPAKILRAVTAGRGEVEEGRERGSVLKMLQTLSLPRWDPAPACLTSGEIDRQAHGGTRLAEIAGEEDRVFVVFVSFVSAYDDP